MTMIRSAYDLPTPSAITELTDVTRGTPMGELLRRYWHPVGLTADAGPTPRQIRVLGEDLILFRDKSGRPGLLYPRCAHRGSSLFYGRTEERGIRCCYHGWLFGVDGACLEQPCEPDGGKDMIGRVRQPHYPLEERYGLIFAYLGPADKKPALPRYDILEDCGPGEFIEADDSSIGSGGPQIVPCNWLQHYENVMDPFHVPILHSSFSGNQFVDHMSVVPKAEFQYSPRGVRSVQLRDLASGKVHRRVTEAVLPTIRAVANPRSEQAERCNLLGWVLPIDTTTFRIYSAGRVTEKGALAKIRSHYKGKLWHELAPEEHQILPGDFEAQVSQGAVTFHSEENLGTTDLGIAMLRRMLRAQVAAVAAGNDPINVSYEKDGVMHIEAGSTIEAGAARA